MTGAGDAFAATMVTLLIEGMALREALRWPPVNAAAVSRQFGTQSGLLRRKDLVARLDAAPQFIAHDL